MTAGLDRLHKRLMPSQMMRIEILGEIRIKIEQRTGDPDRNQTISAEIRPALALQGTESG
jgi:hypothetical protein